MVTLSLPKSNIISIELTVGAHGCAPCWHKIHLCHCRHCCQFCLLLPLPVRSLLWMLRWAITRVITDNLNLSNDCPYASVGDVGWGWGISLQMRQTDRFSTATTATFSTFATFVFAAFAAFSARSESKIASRPLPLLATKDSRLSALTPLPPLLWVEGAGG